MPVNHPATEAGIPGYTTPDTPHRTGLLTKESLDPIVKDASDGDPAAIQALLRMITPVVVRYCRARLGGRNLAHITAEDVAQEVCMAALIALPGYQDRGGSFLHLVYAIAANKVADAFHANSRDRTLPVADLPDVPDLDGENSPENHVLGQHLGKALSQLLATLQPRHRELIVLRMIIGLSATETAEALGLTPGAVRVMQHRVLHKLRKEAADHPEWAVSAPAG